MQVSAGESSKVILAPRHQVRFQSLDEVSGQSASAYCMPSSKTRESFDFICQPEEMGLVTTSLNHGAKASGLRAVHGILARPKASKQAWLTFVVPPDKFADFNQQKIIGPLNTKKFNIRQRVLKMPLAYQASHTILMPALRFL